MWPVYTKEYWLRETCKMAPPLSFSSGYFSIILPMAQMNVYKNAANPDPDFSGKVRILETACQIEL